ncbi:MAG: potassium channel family protein [Pseudomonas sp.]
MKKISVSDPVRPTALLALVLSIPAFYLLLSGPEPLYRAAGSLLYGVTALLLTVDIAVRVSKAAGKPSASARSAFDGLILLGALASAWPSEPPWPLMEWLLRLGFCALVFARLAMFFAKWIMPRRLLQTLVVAAALLALAGAGFYWLEPSTSSYADGVWLAFVTGATVGYGDLVPSTPASRILAVFIVLLGYALFSVVTASIAALFVGEDEKRMERELHADIRSLRAEIAELRKKLE